MLRFDNSATAKATDSQARAEVSVLPVAAATLPAEKTAEDPALTPFLDEILRRMASLPADLHPDIRRELCAHMESLIAAHETLGMSYEDSIVASWASSVT